MGPLLGRASRRVEFLCNNEAVVSVLKSGTSRDPNFMALLRYLSILAVRSSFSFTSSSVQGKNNPIADSVSFPVPALQTLRPTCRLGSNSNSSVALGLPPSSLMDRSTFFLMHVLAQSTRHVYLLAQSRYIAFCCQDG